MEVTNQGDLHGIMVVERKVWFSLQRMGVSPGNGLVVDPALRATSGSTRQTLLEGKTDRQYLRPMHTRILHSPVR